MSLAALLGRGRAAAETQMVDACTVTGEGTGRVWNPATNAYEAAPGPVLYQGRCKVQERDALAVREVDVGERERGLTRPEVHLPVASDGYRTDPATGRPYVIGRGAMVTVTAARFDAQMVGRSFRVVGSTLGTAKTARRLPVEALV